MKYLPFEINNIQISNRKRDSISFPQNLMTLLQISPGDSLTISAGCSEFKVNVAEPINESFTLISENISSKIGLYEGQTLSAKQFEKYKIKIGPFLGVFINIGSVKSISMGTPHQRLVELAKASIEETAITYFFSIRDINWPKYQIRGYCYNTRAQTWHQLTFPLPDVLYDRGGGFLTKQLPVAKYIRKQFALEDKLQKLNTQHYFNKWKNHQILSNHKEMKKYLPDTVKFETTDDLIKMLGLYSCVYLKSCEGSNGRQVMRVRKVTSSKYELNYFEKEVITRTTDSLDDIVDTANRLFNGRVFIIQQGIDVLEYQGNNVDMRALLQRNKTGKWQITAVPVRIAHDHCGITSTSTGSNCYQFDYAYSKLLKFSSNQLEKLKTQVTELLYAAVNTIESEYGRFGEIGIDLALDRQGKLWFIESNAKPGKDTILLSGNEDANRDSFLVPIQYTKYLTGFYGD